MNYNAILDRILQTVDTSAYGATVAHLHGSRQADAEASRIISTALADESVGIDMIRRMVDRMESESQVDKVVALSLRHVIAAHPRVKDYQEAARIAGEQEVAAWQIGGEHLDANLASVDRHRGVVAFLMGHYPQALDHFARALERQRTANNIQNVLATLLRLGEETDAQSLLTQIRTSYPEAVTTQLDRIIQRDPDLALLRQEED